MKEFVLIIHILKKINIMDIILVLWLLFLIFRLGFELGRSVGINQVKKIIDKN